LYANLKQVINIPCLELY